MKCLTLKQLLMFKKVNVGGGSPYYKCTPICLSKSVSYDEFVCRK